MDAQEDFTLIKASQQTLALMGAAAQWWLWMPWAAWLPPTSGDLSRLDSDPAVRRGGAVRCGLCQLRGADSGAESRPASVNEAY